MSGSRIVTLGCRLNAFESETIRRHLQAVPTARDIIVVNTCAVTNEAEARARQALRRARRDHPGALVVATGCAAQIAPDRFAAMAEVDHVVGNIEKLEAETWRRIGAGAPERLVGAMARAPTPGGGDAPGPLHEGFEGRTRAVLEVQNGCDHQCTFCIIPQGRGPARSVPMGVIVDRVRQMLAGGYREIVFSGVDITSYGRDLPGRPTLGRMLRRVLALCPDLPRLRLSSLDPAAIDADLWTLLSGEPRLMPYLHLSVQAGHDLILKRMRRRHGRDQVVDVCRRAREARPDILLGADLIAGFPTETEAMFEATLRLVDEADLTFLHVFPYSARTGTPAARMPQIPGDVRRRRAARLRAAGDNRLRGALERQAGTEVAALMERDGLARTANFLPLEVPAGPPPGTLFLAAIDGSDGRMLRGRIRTGAMGTA